MARLGPFLVSIGLAIILAACGGEDSEGPASSGDTLQGRSAGDANRGRTVFLDSGCGACHTFATADATGSVGPDFDKTLEPDADKAGKPLKTFIRESIVEPDAFVAAGFQPGVMPGDFGEKLTDQQLADVVSFLTEHRSPQR